MFLLKTFTSSELLLKISSRIGNRNWGLWNVDFFSFAFLSGRPIKMPTSFKSGRNYAHPDSKSMSKNAVSYARVLYF